MTFRKALRFGSSVTLLGLATFFLPAAPAQAASINVLHGFCAQANCADGSNVRAGLLRDAAGNFFGMTEYGGAGVHCIYAAGCGTVFELVLTESRYLFRPIYNFCSRASCMDGNWPEAGLIADAAGNLYGTTERGGKHGAGIAFRLIPGTPWKLQKLYDFCSRAGCTDGSDPFATLTYVGQAAGALYDGTSDLYGTTSDGGANDKGVVFRLTVVPGKVRRKEKVLHDFCATSNCPDGANPFGLIADAHRNLFGVTQNGGANAGVNSEAGVLYEISHKHGHPQLVLYSFCAQPNCADGRSPNGAPVLDATGGIVGTTVHGGTVNGDGGVLYRFAPKTSQYTVLHTFCSQASCDDGYYPFAGVTLDANGDIYGTVLHGGGATANCPYSPGCGLIYRVHNGAYAQLYAFCSLTVCADGDSPSGALALDAAGHLLGTTYDYGAHGDATTGGTVFELTP